MTHTYTARLVNGLTAAGRGQAADDADREDIVATVRANAGLVIAWASLAVAIAAYAFDRESIGAAIVAVFVAWQLLVPWRVVAARGHDQVESRPIAFR